MKNNGIDVSLLIRDNINVNLTPFDSRCNVQAQNSYSLDLFLNISSGISISTRIVESIVEQDYGLMDCDGLLLLESDGKYLYALC